MASVFDFESGVLVQPRWTSRPNCTKMSLIKVVPVIRFALDKKMKVESSA